MWFAIVKSWHYLFIACRGKTPEAESSLHWQATTVSTINLLKSLLHKLEQTKAIRAGRIHPVFIVTGLWASKRCAPTTNCPARGELEEAQRGRWRQSTRTLTQLRTQAVSARQPLWLLPLILCINKAPCCTRERMRSSGAKWTDSGWGDCTLLQRRGGRVVLQIHEVH